MPDTVIPALSLSRPWTSLILYSGKTVENRPWRTHYRGPLIIHGAKSFDPTAARFFDDLRANRFSDLNPAVLAAAQPLGYLGVVDLVGVHKDGDANCGDCPWGMADKWHWEVENPRPFNEPIPGPGRLNVYTPPEHVQDIARAVLLGRPYELAPVTVEEAFTGYLFDLS